jgi:hypothetical protein
VSPNNSFLKQLAEYEKKLFGKNSDLNTFLQKKGKNLHNNNNVRFIPVYVPKSKRNLEIKNENPQKNEILEQQNEEENFEDECEDDDNEDEDDSENDFDEMMKFNK